MTARRDLPEDLRDRPFAVRDALARPVPAHRLKAMDLVSPFHGVRAPASVPLDLVGRCRALATRFRPGDAFAGHTAVALWGAPLPIRFGEGSALCVSSLSPRRALRRRGVHGIQRSAGAIVHRFDVPLLRPEDAWLSLAPHLAVPDLVAVADFLVTGRKGKGVVSSIADLERMLARSAGHPGVALARHAARLVRVGSWSRPESLVRVLLASARLPEPVLNVPIERRGGGILIPDIAFPEYRVAVEYNGFHHDDPSEKVKDLRRMDDFTELGWSVVNVDRADLFGAPASVIIRTGARLRERGWSGGVTADLTEFASVEP